MNIAVLVIVGIVALLGLVAFGLGTRGWSWGTVIAAFLAFFSAVGFVYYAARVGERERAWREKVRGLQVQIARTRDAQEVGADGSLTPLAGERSLESLAMQLDRWKRANERSQLWRGRFWEGGKFQPPRGAGGEGAVPGALRFELADAAADVPLDAGAQIYLFDDASVEEGGQYLGAFLIEKSEKDGGQFRLTLVPALPPTPAEEKLWSKSYESVTAFEQLPNDSWITFLRTPTPPKREESADEIIPPMEKDGSEKVLERLESRLAEFEKHEAPVTEEEWRPLVDGKKIPPGLYWATVEFTEPHALTPPAGAKPAEDEGGGSQFEAGDTAEFDLETAAGLVEAKVAEIKDVVYRRKLIDATTALRGENIRTARDESIRARGLIVRRDTLVRHIAEIKATRDSLRIGLEKTAATLQVLREEETDLSADLDRWKQDADAAEEVATDFTDRLAVVRQALEDAWGTVVRWGREYDGSMALLQAEVDKQAPPPE